jgi:secondary thiamine-phosphate synthase enzyme
MDPSASTLRAFSTTAPASQFTMWAETLEYATERGLQFIDITEDVRAVVERSGITAGQVSVFSKHTTAAVIVNEHEPLLLNDMARTLSRLAPAEDYYEHNDFSIRTVNVEENEPPNGHSHCQHLFLGASETVPVHDGQILLGRWQSIFLVELDHARPRAVFVQAMGITGS